MNDLLKLNKKRISNHWQYSKWYYIAAIIAAVIIVNLAYTMSEPSYPKESTVSILMFAGVGDEDIVEVWENDMLALLGDDQRQVSISTSVVVEGSTESVIIARMTAGDDDILIMDTETMMLYAQGGAFKPIDELIDVEGAFAKYSQIDWDSYFMTSEELGNDEEHIYFLPLYMAEGFDEIGFSGQDLAIAVLAKSVNAENAAICLEYIMTK